MSKTPAHSTAGWRWRRWAPLGVYPVFVLLLFWRLWSPVGGGQTWKYDPQHEYWGDIEFQRQTLSEGDIALWNPYDRGGFPLHGDPQPGLLYPGNWPLVTIAAALGDTPYPLVELKIILHWLLGALGMHVFLRRRRCPEVACYLGGLLMCVTCPALRVTGSALNWSWAWFPWILVAIDAFGERRDLRRALLLGAAIAMPLLAGAPALSWYALLFATPFLVARLWPFRRDWRQLVIPLGVATVAALAWIAPLVASNLEIVPHTERAATGVSFFASRGLEPKQLLNLVIPPLAGGESIFVGGMVLVMLGSLASGATRWASATSAPAMAPLAVNRSLARASVASALLGAVFAMGDTTPLMPALGSLLPPVRLFRYAYRYSFIITAALAAGGGLGLGMLLRAELSRARRRRLLGLGLGLGALLAVAWIVAAAWAPSSGAARHASRGLAIATLSTLAGSVCLHLALRADGRARHRWAGAMVAILIAAVWIANYPLQDVGFGPRPSTERDATLERLDGVRDHQYRIFDADYFTYRPGTRLRVRDFRGYEEDPLRLVRYKRYLTEARRHPRLLAHANVRYYLEAGAAKLRVRHRRGMKRLERGVYELENVAPAVFFVADPVVVDDLQGALRALRRLEPGVAATVERPGRAGEERAAPKRVEREPPVVSGRFTSYAPDRIVAEIDTPGPGLVVVNEAYFPAWTATIDGRPVDIAIANGMFRGVWVESAGRHRIVMELSPPRFWWLLPVYLAALLATIIALGLTRRRVP